MPRACANPRSPQTTSPGCGRSRSNRSPPWWRVARAQYEHAIGTIANLKLSEFSIPPSPLDLPLPKVPVGVPSQLLERRPDIAAAERRAAAANAQIGIAVSAFYPTITLNGTGGFESMNVGTWVQE